jgi:hypothetical protein
VSRPIAAAVSCCCTGWGSGSPWTVSTRLSMQVAWLYVTAENEIRIGGGRFAVARTAHPCTREVGAFRRCPSAGAWGAASCLARPCDRRDPGDHGSTARCRGHRPQPEADAGGVSRWQAEGVPG